MVGIKKANPIKTKKASQINQNRKKICTLIEFSSWQGLCNIFMNMIWDREKKIEYCSVLYHLFFANALLFSNQQVTSTAQGFEPW